MTAFALLQTTEVSIHGFQKEAYTTTPFFFFEGGQCAAHRKCRSASQRVRYATGAVGGLHPGLLSRAWSHATEPSGNSGRLHDEPLYRVIGCLGSPGIGALHGRPRNANRHRRADCAREATSRYIERS